MDLIEVKENRLTAEKDRLSYLVPQLHYVPVCPISAMVNSGMPNLVQEIIRVHSQLYIKVSTSMLNRDVGRWVEANSPPIVRRRRGKIKFIAQSGVSPVVFKARVNNPAFFPEAYKQYIINKIRAKYSFKNIPIQLYFVPNKD